jgi:hypothetical protein
MPASFLTETVFAERLRMRAQGRAFAKAAEEFRRDHPKEHIRRQCERFKETIVSANEALRALLEDLAFREYLKAALERGPVDPTSRIAGFGEILFVLIAEHDTSMSLRINANLVLAIAQEHLKNDDFHEHLRIQLRGTLDTKEFVNLAYSPVAAFEKHITSHTEESIADLILDAFGEPDESSTALP